MPAIKTDSFKEFLRIASIFEIACLRAERLLVKTYSDPGGNFLRPEGALVEHWKLAQSRHSTKDRLRFVQTHSPFDPFLTVSCKGEPCC
ncbi:hypothetical protein IG197_11465 [Aminobacter sp. SR38]|uniref:hypothetical protein n=1 Tax=Aminobacter sp. SR38 TaxID=2774562 RepID=UPI00177B2024|nr:hypothetical protein [Aminobacter sp. SR38]QOF73623.1 hypothetical protein IG197_11465 [Aminobacter sp. SR38]